MIVTGIDKGAANPVFFSDTVADGIISVGGFGTEGIGYGNQSIILVICFVAVLVSEGRDLTGCGR